MVTVKIKSLGRQSILSSKDYEYLQSHIGEELPVMSLNYSPAGELWSIAIYTVGYKDCITMFINENKLKYEVSYNV